MANDQEPQSPAAPASGSSPAPEPAARRYERPATWPLNVPPPAQALEILRGTQKPAVLLPSTHRVLDSLTWPEREALRVDGLADTLRSGLVVRWRLAAARDLLPAAAGKVDQAGLDALLAEADRTIAQLREANAPTPELGLAIDRASEALTHEALEFASYVKQAQEAGPRPPPRRTTTSMPAVKVTFQQEQPKGARRKKWLPYAALGLIVLLAGGYHGYGLLTTQPQQPSYPGAPPDTFVAADQRTSTLMVRTLKPGPLSPQQEAWLNQFKARGMQVKELGAGSYLVLPAPKPTADNAPP